MRKYLIIGGAILAVFVLVIASVILISSQQKERRQVEKIELVWWKTFQESGDVSELISQYQEANPGVSIKFAKKDIATFENEWLNAMASNNSPDIVSIHNDWLPKHMDKLAPAPVSVMSTRQYSETFMDVATADFVVDGSIYAMPMSVDVLALFYNRDILGSAGISQPPKTWPEVVTAVERMTRIDPSGTFSYSGIAMGTSSNVNRAVDLLTLLMLQNGTDFYRQENSFAIFDQNVRTETGTTNPGALALQFYTQFAQPSKKAYTWNSRSDNSVDAFSQGKVGMMLAYSYMIPMIESKAPTLQWGIAPAPQIDNSGIKVNMANYWGEAVSKSSAHQAEAWKFIKYLTEQESLAKYYAKRPMPTSRKDMVDGQKSDVKLGVFAENALTAKSVYKKDANKFESIFLEMINNVILRNYDAEDAISDAARQVNLLLRQ